MARATMLTECSHESTIETESRRATACAAQASAVRAPKRMR